MTDDRGRPPLTLIVCHPTSVIRHETVFLFSLVGGLSHAHCAQPQGIAFETVPVHLTRNGGQQHGAEFLALNPQRRVPALALDAGEVLLQSLAIMEYLDEVYPTAAAAEGPDRRAQQCGRWRKSLPATSTRLNNLGPLSYLRHTPQV